MAKHKARIWWATPERDLHGNALGYGTHNAEMRKHTLPLIENDPEADVVLHIVSGDHFEPFPGKINILFTMWEFLDVPKSYQEALAKADWVIVPCSFCRDIFAPYCKRKPIVCWEGVDPDKYKFVQRKAGDKFRFLWVGAPNPRKGYQSVLKVIGLADRFPNIEFYLKTTTKKISFLQAINGAIKNWRNIVRYDGSKGAIQRIARIISRIPSPFNAEKIFVWGKNRNVFVDTRKVPFSELMDMYAKANAFLFPTLGEGWGLTLTEAMATGLPCIAPAETGCADYFDDSVGYTIKTRVMDLGALPNYGLKSCKAYVPDTQNLLDQMVKVCNNYEDALHKGKRASDRIRIQFTWKRSGERLANILEDICQKEGIDEKGHSNSNSGAYFGSVMGSAI